jgi:hypothetical protein
MYILILRCTYAYIYVYIFIYIRAALAASQESAVRTFHGQSASAPADPPPLASPFATNENLALFAAIVRDNPSLVLLAQERKI